MERSTTIAKQGNCGGQRPRREVRDFIKDLGHAEHRGDSRLVKIHPYRLPGYLRNLPVMGEAMRWVMVVSDGGAVIRWLRLKPWGPQHPARGDA